MFILLFAYKKVGLIQFLFAYVVIIVKCFNTTSLHGGIELFLTMLMRYTKLLMCFRTVLNTDSSSVIIATGYGLDGSGIESRWGARFSAPVQTGPGAHPAFCTMGTGSFPGVKSCRGVTLTPHPF